MPELFQKHEIATVLTAHYHGFAFCPERQPGAVAADHSRGEASVFVRRKETDALAGAGKPGLFRPGFRLQTGGG
jgi:hypothetical protein